MTSRPRRRRASERGATLTEYALVVAVLVVGCIGAIATLEDESGRYYERTADDIGDLPPEDTTTTASIPGSTTSTTAGVTTTAPPPTTTTTSTTTTSTTTTTTTPSGESRIAQIQDRSYTQSSSRWAARARFYVKDSGDNAVQGANVSSTWTADDGTSASGSCVTNSSGYCQLTWYNRRGYHDPVTVEVTNVVSSPDWDGSTASRLLERP